MADKTRPSDARQVPSGKTDWAALDAMSDADAEAAAIADLDAQPAASCSHRMATAKRVRMTLKLSPQTFAERYHIPLATLLAWERHELDPDPVARAFLAAIAADPAGVAAALARAQADAAE